MWKNAKEVYIMYCVVEISTEVSALTRYPQDRTIHPSRNATLYLQNERRCCRMHDITIGGSYPHSVAAIVFKKSKWITAICKNNWNPGTTTWICGCCFVLHMLDFWQWEKQRRNWIAMSSKYLVVRVSTCMCVGVVCDLGCELCVWSHDART